MHMADALISPAVGGVLWAVTAATVVVAAKKLRDDEDNSLIPLMGVVGAFIFAVQMLNFTIPLTGSSGHLGGGLLLAIILGRHAGFLTMVSVLSVQALFFADGGLLALGCNIFNLGFIPAYVIYPYIYKPLIARFAKYRFAVIMFSAILGLQLGAFGVVLETLISGVSELSFGQFLLLMQPIHLAIGVVEGVAAALTIEFVSKLAPEYLKGEKVLKSSMNKLAISFLMLAVIAGAGLSLYASSKPDGLEWAISKVAGVDELEAPATSIFESAKSLQDSVAIMPDYSFGDDNPVGTTVAGILGIVITSILAFATGFFLIRRKGE